MKKIFLAFLLTISVFVWSGCAPALMKSYITEPTEIELHEENDTMRLRPHPQEFVMYW